MNSRAKTTAAALAGAAVLASGAYAVGSQEGGGGADAATAGARGFGPPPGAGFRRGAAFGPGLSALAKRLGVSEEKLRAALQDVRPPGPPGPGRFVNPLSGLAGALGVPESKLRDAFLKVQKQRQAAFPKQLADALGVDESKVRAALDKQRSKEDAEHNARRDQLATALAKRLGIPKSRVESALRSLPHPGPGGPGRGGPGPAPGGPWHGP